MFSFEEINAINAELEGREASEIVAWASERFGDRITLASSFGAEDMVLIDLIAKSKAGPRIFLLDTGRLHQETYDVVEAARQRYGLTIDVYAPATEALEALVREQGPNGFYGSREAREACCHVRKVEPLGRALADVDAWITGQRRAQSPTRSLLPYAERDSAHGAILKLNPLIHWSEDQVWDYLRAHDVPVNALHAKGFPSIGCAPCTRAIAPGEDIRAGRWWWEEPEHKECGLHKRP